VDTTGKVRSVEQAWATPARSAGGTWRRFARRHKINGGLIFVLPALVVYLLFAAWPIVSILQLSVYNWNGVSPTRTFVGLGNYVQLLTNDIAFRLSIRNNVLWALLTTAFLLVFGFLLAYLLNQPLRARNVYRTALFLPVTVSSVVVGFTWFFIYNPTVGLLNVTLHTLGLAPLARAWLGDPQAAIYAIIAVAIWQGLGAWVVIFLAALQSVPHEIYESASIDGANGWQKMLFIAVPLTRFTAEVLVILGLIGAVKAFDLVYLLTRGGPYHASEVMALGVYLQAFNLSHAGYAAALSVVLLLISALITVAQLRLYTRTANS
jgi:raffinose/stachyose/melibiose transport system permease protein